MPMRLMCGTADGWPAGNFVPDSLLSLARSLSGGTRERPRIFFTPRKVGVKDKEYASL